jgi:hypothetical protein
MSLKEVILEINDKQQVTAKKINRPPVSPTKNL